MSATVYKWIIVYEGGYTEEKHGTCPSDFADDIVDVPIAIIREGWWSGNEYIDVNQAGMVQEDHLRRKNHRGQKDET